MGGQGAGGVTGVDPGFFDMFHDAAHKGAVAVAQAIHIDLNRFGQIGIDQNRRVTGNHNGFVDIALKPCIFTHDFHRSTTQNIGWSDHDRVTNFLDDFARFLDRPRNAVDGLFEIKVMKQLLETVAILSKINGIRSCAQNRHAGFFQGIGKAKRCLPAKLNDHALKLALGLFGAHNFQHIFGCQRFEIETVRRVVVSGNRFRITIDHDRFIVGIRQREGGMTAAIIELNPLSNPVWAAAQNHHFFSV